MTVVSYEITTSKRCQSLAARPERSLLSGLSTSSSPRRQPADEDRGQIRQKLASEE